MRDATDGRYRDPPGTHTMRGAYHCLRREGLGIVGAAIHAPVFYVVAYRYSNQVAHRLTQEKA